MVEKKKKKPTDPTAKKRKKKKEKKIFGDIQLFSPPSSPFLHSNLRIAEKE